MAAPAAVDVISQIGVESTHGTAVACNRKLPTLSIVPEPELGTQEFRAAGYKNPTSTAIERMFATGSYSGLLDFNSIIYVLSSLVGHSGTPTPPGGGTLSRQWDFSPATSGSDSLVKTYTGQVAPLSTAAQQFAGIKFSSFTLNSSQDSVGVSGNLIAAFPTEGVTLTSSPTEIAERPVTRMMVNAYIDSTYGGIGGTKLTDVYQETFAVGAKDLPFFVHDTTYAGGFKETVEQAHELTYTIRTAHTAQSRSQFSLISSNPTQFMRWEATGALIEGSIYERARFNFAGGFKSAKPLRSDGAVYGYEYVYTVKHNSTMGHAWDASVINQLTGL